MIHKHQFVRAGECEKYDNISSKYPSKLGLVYVCIDLECDAVRQVWSDGTKDVVKEGLPDREEIE